LHAREAVRFGLQGLADINGLPRSLCESFALAPSLVEAMPNLHEAGEGQGQGQGQGLLRYNLILCSEAFFAVVLQLAANRP
jgi:hypothetical protein